MIKVMTVFGTRPEAIKMAPVVLELKKHADKIQTVVAVTAQHRQMLDQVLELFRIEPDYDLDIMSQGQTLYDITTKSLMGLKSVLETEKPDIVLVHGDTTTTFAGALAAYYQQIPVGHVEAGLRTGNIYSPFPEEMNRKLTGSIAAIHFAPTATAKANLLKEAVAEKNIYVTGNTVIDALMKTVDPAYTFEDEMLNHIDFLRHRVILMTTHRRENLGEPMRHIYKALRSIVEEIPDTEVVFPVHRNPLVRKVVEESRYGSRVPGAPQSAGSQGCRRGIIRSGPHSLDRSDGIRALCQSHEQMQPRFDRFGRHSGRSAVFRQACAGAAQYDRTA